VSHRALAEDVRAELAAIAPTRRCDRLAEASAIFHTAGTVHLRGRGALAFHLDVATNAIARRAFALLRALRVEAEIRTYQRHAFSGETRYQLHLGDDAHTLGVLVEAGVLDPEHVPLERPPGRVVAKPCCRGAYLRGVFLGGGSLSGPRSPHLELRAPTHAGAAFVRSVASTEGARLGVVDRPGHAAAYAKGRESIEAFLAAAGAVETVLVMEEQALVAELRAEANRLANADHANLVRQSRAARRQLEAVSTLRTRGALEQLPEPVREAGELRSRNPALSLRELAAKADPPATKAAMQRRLARLVAAAETG
jgi:cell division protein WhiA